MDELVEVAASLIGVRGGGRLIITHRPCAAQPGARGSAYNSRMGSDNARTERAEDMAAIAAVVEALAGRLVARGESVTTCESCTGGWIAKCLTDVPGSSAWFAGGLVTYSDALKQRLVGVPSALLLEHGAVSEPVAAAMASGCAERLDSAVALAVSGIAGPGGATPGKPVGLVCFGWRLADGRVHSDSRRFAGDRDAVRHRSVRHALEGLLARLDDRA
jgi:nicotinamide-nucleotide amidase